VAVLSRTRQLTEAAVESLLAHNEGMTRAEAGKDPGGHKRQLGLPVVCDVRDPQAVKSAVEFVQDQMKEKQINVLVNAAGISKDAVLLRLVALNACACFP
jgi:NAD(P)-dependent dehydrogenase (short-subunit alcohol dehydrogenase family)